VPIKAPTQITHFGITTPPFVISEITDGLEATGGGGGATGRVGITGGGGGPIEVVCDALFNALFRAKHPEA